MVNLIRVACSSDAAEMLEIYRPYVENTAITFEWDVPTIEDFALRVGNTLKRYPWLVACDNDGRIIGYAYAGEFHGRKAYDWAVELSIYVGQNSRRKGTGRALYCEMESILQRQYVTNAEACIACPKADGDPFLTDDSIRFHQKMGFRMVGRFDSCGNKFDRWYDMVWMEKIIGEHTSPQHDFIPFLELDNIGPELGGGFRKSIRD